MRGTQAPLRTAAAGAAAVFCSLTFFFALLLAGPEVASAVSPGERQHLIFFKGTPQEMEVFKIYGRLKGPTIMIMGGIQGDEPGGFLSAELYTDLALKKGNLIVVPRANFRSVVMNDRGPAGDMNRKFKEDLPDDPEADVVGVLKSLMAESDVFLNLHDGSGYYRPTWESEMANPRRYGQCVISDAAVYTHEPTGRKIPLKEPAEEAVRRVNRDISTPLHKFHYFNMETVRDDTRYPEQRKSATYCALTEFGIPAFGIETSKQLPALEMKIHQHALAVNAFLDIYGVEPERHRISLDKPVLGYVVIAVNDAPPIAAAAGQTLTLAPGDTIELLHVHANYEHGLSAEIESLEGLNDMNRPVRIDKATNIVVRRDSATIGTIAVKLFEEKGRSPMLTGENRAGPSKVATPATPDMLPGAKIIAEAKARAKAAATAQAKAGDIAGGQAEPGGVVTGFLVEVNGKPVEIKPGSQIQVPRGAKVKIVDLKVEGGGLPKGVVMNLKGFVPKDNALSNNGEDRGHTADTARDMMPAFSEGRKGEVYAINAELGKTILAFCSIRIAQPQRVAVTLRYMDQTRTLSFGSRIAIPVGAKVELLEVVVPGGPKSGGLRYTLAGHPLPVRVPQTLTMRDIAINLAVFDGDVLIGKITWVPQ